MISRIEKEITILEKEYGEIDFSPTQNQIIFKNIELPDGWSKKHIRLMLQIPAGYPATPPDNFYTEIGLTLNNNQVPGATSLANFHGVQWFRFSYHMEGVDWKPNTEILNGHNFITFMNGVMSRLEELS